MEKQSVYRFGATLLLQNLMAGILSFSFLTFFKTFGGFETAGLIVGFLIYFAAIYIYTWNKGYKDATKCRFGHIERNPLFGLQAGLAASIVSVGMMILFFSTSINNPKGVEIAVQMLVRLWFAPVLQLVIQYQKTPLIYLYPLAILILPTISGFGYWLGLKEIRLRKRAVYQEDVKYDYPSKDNSAKSVLDEKNRKNLKK